jgi:hypothetical protein
MHKGKDLTYRQEIGRAVYEAMITASGGGSTWSRDDSASRV